MIKKYYFIPFIFGLMVTVSAHLAANEEQEKNNEIKTKQLKKSLIKIRKTIEQKNGNQTEGQNFNHLGYSLNDPQLQTLSPTRRLIVPYKVTH